MVLNILNEGVPGYKKMMFACFSLLNPGIICEHDIFLILEKFRQKDTFFFVQELI